MYHKNRRRRQRFYPEFYDDDEIEIKKEIELRLADDANSVLPEEVYRSEITETPANYNDLLYPNNIKAASVFKQLENMQKDYIKKKLEVSRTNNINLYSDITGNDENINRNEAEIISEQNNEMRIEIPDDMYTGEIHNTEDTQADNIQEQETPQINGSEDYILTPDSDDGSEDNYEPEEVAEEDVSHFEHESIEQNQPDTEPENLDETEQPFNQINEPAQLVAIQHAEPISELGFTPFDKVKAIEYAHRWALDRNPAFLNFDEMGGDCANYVSQLLLAGGCQMDHTPIYGWSSSTWIEKSPSWTCAEQLYNYLLRNKEHGIIAQEISAEEAEAGDIVQLSFNDRTFQHTPFIVEVSRTQSAAFDFEQIKICAHSFDSQNRALDTYQWRKIRFIRILGYK